MAEMTKEAAQQALYEHVFIPAFVEKLAALGIAPKTEADLNEMLKIAEALDAAAQGGLVPADAPESGADAFLKQASVNLYGMLEQAAAAAQVPVLAREAVRALRSADQVTAK